MMSLRRGALFHFREVSFFHVNKDIQKILHGTAWSRRPENASVCMTEQALLEFSTHAMLAPLIHPSRKGLD